MSSYLFHPDEKDRKILGSRVMVEGPDKPVLMEMYVCPSGSVRAKPVPQAGIDQVGEQPGSHNRHQGVDQF